VKTSASSRRFRTRLMSGRITANISTIFMASREYGILCIDEISLLRLLYISYKVGVIPSAFPMTIGHSVLRLLAGSPYFHKVCNNGILMGNKPSYYPSSTSYTSSLVLDLQQQNFLIALKKS
jgi:hypothetical protein